MDLLYRRYASPFVLLDTVIECCGFSEFIDDFLDFSDQSECWEYFLHKVFDKSYNEFIDGLKPQPEMTVGEIETKIQKAYEVQWEVSDSGHI